MAPYIDWNVDVDVEMDVDVLLGKIVREHSYVAASTAAEWLNDGEIDSGTFLDACDEDLLSALRERVGTFSDDENVRKAAMLVANDEALMAVFRARVGTTALVRMVRGDEDAVLQILQDRPITNDDVREYLSLVSADEREEIAEDFEMVGLDSAWRNADNYDKQVCVDDWVGEASDSEKDNLMSTHEMYRSLEQAWDEADEDEHVQVVNLATDRVLKECGVMRKPHRTDSVARMAFAQTWLMVLTEQQRLDVIRVCTPPSLPTVGEVIDFCVSHGLTFTAKFQGDTAHVHIPEAMNAEVSRACKGWKRMQDDHTTFICTRK
jgi:hypothetical protein